MKRDPVYYAYCKKTLLKTRLFSGLDESVLDDMLVLFRRDTWRRGTRLNAEIFKVRFYLIIEGRLEVSRVNPDTGKSITLSLLGPGDGIDVVTLLNNEPHEVMPVAIDDISLISVPIKDARDWIDRHPEFNRNFLPYLGEQMRKLEDLSTDLALYDTMTRLARLILRHVVPLHSQSKDKAQASVMESGQDPVYRLDLINDLHDESLARMVGSVRQVVNRHLQHWRKQGVLHKKNFKTQVTELEALQTYANDSREHLQKNKAL